MKNKLQLIISICLLLIAVMIFGIYISQHTYLIDRLRNISPFIIFWLLVLYMCWFFCLSLIIKYSLRICNLTIPSSKNLLLNAYSTIVNFFLPGQGGPAIRAAYLYKKHKLRIRLYIFVTLIYYLVYTVVNLVLALGWSSWRWLLIPLIIIISLISIFGGRKYISKFKIKPAVLNLNPINLFYLSAVTLLQIFIIMVINFVELHSINSGISISQIATYTGIANLSIFVALTPGAIGIREGFLIFGRRLHHISVTNIISASIIDRSIFLIVLVILLCYVVATHAKTKLYTENSPTNPKIKSEDL
jgi:uncharacterized membrane protein YbhN (UPF0104 family)